MIIKGYQKCQRRAEAVSLSIFAERGGFILKLFIMSEVMAEITGLV